MLITPKPDRPARDETGCEWRALRTGHVYRVIGIEYDDYRIAPDGELPSLFPIFLFDIVDGAVEPGWRVTADAEGFMHLAFPEADIRGFWEDVWDLKPEALRTLDTILARMVAIEPERPIRPLNRALLERLLHRHDYDPQIYSLRGGNDNDTICLSQEDGRWCTYYTERGARADMRWFDTEGDACNALLATLRRLPYAQSRTTSRTPHLHAGDASLRHSGPERPSASQQGTTNEPEP